MKNDDNAANVTYINDGHTAVFTIDNPPANTWTSEELLSLMRVIEILNKDPKNRSLIIKSDNEKFFSAGAELKHFHHDDKGRAFDLINAFGKTFEALANYRGVSIAAITGYAMGGGLEVALACDFRIAEQHSRLGLPECRVGLLPGGLGTQHLPWLIGEAWAKRMILLGEVLYSHEALTVGLVQEVVPTGKAFDKALELAEKVELQSPGAVRACKQLIMAARKQPLVANFSVERELFVHLWNSEDRREGVAAFVEKRDPTWQGR